jgi:hypothetical protein
MEIGFGPQMQSVALNYQAVCGVGRDHAEIIAEIILNDSKP